MRLLRSTSSQPFRIARRKRFSKQKIPVSEIGRLLACLMRDDLLRHLGQISVVLTCPTSVDVNHRRKFGLMHKCIRICRQLREIGNRSPLRAQDTPRVRTRPVPFLDLVVIANSPISEYQDLRAVTAFRASSIVLASRGRFWGKLGTNARHHAGLRVNGLTVQVLDRVLHDRDH